MTMGAFHLGKNPEISVVAKVEFPIGKKLFHLVLNPGTSLCPTVDLELVQTTRNVNGTRHSVRKFQPGKRDHRFRFSLFLGIFRWDEPTKGVPFTAEPEIPEILTKWKAPYVNPENSDSERREFIISSRILLTASDLGQLHNSLPHK